MKEWHRFLGDVVARKQSAIVACEEYVARMHSCVNDFRAVHSSQGICNILHDFDDNLRRKVDHRCLFDSSCSSKNKRASYLVTQSGTSQDVLIQVRR